MGKKIKIVFILLIFNLSISIIFSSTNAVTQTTSTDINSLDNEKYNGIKQQIEELKKQHPNWNFKILYTGIDWNDAIAHEYTGHGSSPKNLVPGNNSSYSGEWICGLCGDTTYDSGNWKCASESAIKYMMDPRNSLNSLDVFQFLELSYNEENGYSKEVLQKMLKDSFLDNDTYLNCIMQECKTYNVNPYYIAARILQEQGKNGTVLVKGQGYNDQYIGYYNVFNIGATGSGKEKIILNGLKTAQKNGWTCMEFAIKGGIETIVKKYIAVGQNTMYFQKFDVENSDGNLYWHQYMQNILAAQNEGSTLRKTLTDINAIDFNYTFIIPIFENMPKQTSARPQIENFNKNVQTDLVKVNVISSIKLRNEPNGSKTIGYLYSGEIVTRIEKATSKVNGTYWDKVLKSDGTVGYVARCTYDRETEYKEYLISTNTENTNIEDNQKSENSSDNVNDTNSNNNKNINIIKGDVNEDGKITSSDYVLIKNHIMGIRNLSEQAKEYADYNQDGKVTSSDYVLIKNYIMSR